MPRNLFSDDVDATAELPQFDMRILSSRLQRTEGHVLDEYQESDTLLLKLGAADIESLLDRSPLGAENANTDWRITDRLTELQDQVASLTFALANGEERHARLLARLEALQKVLIARDQRVAELEQQVRQHSENEAKLKLNLNQATLQRQHREQMILKQALEIRRLREVAL